MKKIILFAILSGASVLTATSSCYADQESEKRYLTAIMTELENIKALAQKAESTRTEGDRLVFDYASLERDLELMRQAINQHVEKPSRQPRRIGALSENYTEQIHNE